jgi:hypothetical protein
MTNRSVIVGDIQKLIQNGLRCSKNHILSRSVYNTGRINIFNKIHGYVQEDINRPGDHFDHCAIHSAATE